MSLGNDGVVCSRCGDQNPQGTAACSNCQQPMQPTGRLSTTSKGQPVSSQNAQSRAKTVKVCGLGCVGLLVLLGIIGSIFGGNSTSEIKPVVDLPSIMGKSGSEVNAALGKPTKTVPITSYPDQMPGEYRNYAVKGLEDLLVRFHNDRAVQITAWFSDGMSDAEELLLAAGIDVNGVSPSVVAPAAKRWTGSYSGVIFDDLGVEKDFESTGISDYYTIVSAKVN